MTSQMLELSPEQWTAVALSLRVASVATVVSLPFGVAVAWVLARKTFPGKALLNAVIYLPLVFGAWLAEHLGIVLAFRWTGAALACGVMAFPLMVGAIRLSIEAVDPKYEAAAGTLGASRAWVFLTITLPLALPGIIAGAVLAFARAIGEFGATITFVSNIPGETQTISAAIYTLTQVPGGDAQALRLVVVAVIISLGALIVSEWFGRRAGRRMHGT
jgi:molybdate transport system permease protein